EGRETRAPGMPDVGSMAEHRRGIAAEDVLTRIRRCSEIADQDGVEQRRRAEEVEIDPYVVSNELVAPRVPDRRNETKGVNQPDGSGVIVGPISGPKIVHSE